MKVVTQFRAARKDKDDDGRAMRFRAMFEGAAVGIAICQLDGRILEVNPSLCRMFGYLPSDKNKPRALWPDRPLLDQLLEGQRAAVETEKRYRRQDGSDFWGHLTVSIGPDSRHQPGFLIALLTDATERKRIDEHLLDEEKMEVIGRMAGGIAHDFNNMLTGVLRYCDLLSAGLENAHVEGLEPVPGDLSQQVQEVRQAAEHGAGLTRQLLSIGRKQTTKLRPILINEIVVSTESLLRRLIGEHLELVDVLDAGAGLVLADPVQLRQILLNLVLNARDAMPGGGRILVSTHLFQLPGEVDPAMPRRAVSLVIKDHGCGMDAETQARMFEPLFTTKGPEAGTGFGLATVERIVGEAGGTIKVETGPGKGTSITVVFQAVETSAAFSDIEQAERKRSAKSGS